MINAIAIDDEINAIGIIKEFSKKIPYIKLLQTFTDPLKVLPFIETSKEKVDIIFLDVHMNKLHGLTLASRLPPQCGIILTTAYPDFALLGYELDVIDYLLKPFSFERFERATLKANSIKKMHTNEATEPMKNKLSPGTDDFIFIKVDYKTIKIKIADIKYIEGSRNYVILYLIKGKNMVLQNLKKFEDQLRPFSFLRIHKSYIVSINHIDSIEKGFVQIGDKSIPIGEAYRDDFHQFLMDYYIQ